MCPVSVTIDEIPPLVADLALVLGLLGREGDGYAFRFDWFADAPEELRRIPSRRRELLDLLRHALGKPIDDPPDDRAWYALPIHSAPAPVYAVLPADDEDPDATIGLGLIDERSTKVRGAAYLPLATVPPGDPPIVTGRTGTPIELSHVVSLGRTITAGDLSFTAVALSARLYIDGTPCSVALELIQSDGTRISARSLREIRNATMRDAIDTVLREPEVVSWLDAKIGESSITRGAAFVTAELLEHEDAYTLAPLDFTGDASAIARRLLANTLALLAKNKKPFVTLGAGGVWVFAVERDEGVDYGLRLAVPDVKLSSAGGAACVIQIGKLLTGDADDQSWISRSDVNDAVPLRAPGIAVTLVRSNEDGGAISFRRRVDLVSVGLDAVGLGSDPLFDVMGVRVSAVEPRFLFSWDLDDDASYWGAAIGLREIGFPLGGGLAAGSANPVAQSLLASGPSSGEPVNPTFTAGAGRVFDPGGTAALDVSMYENGAWRHRVWIPVQRAFGPLQCRRVGVEWPEHGADSRLHVLFDGGVALGPLGLDLEGLAVGMPLDAPARFDQYSLDLQGIGISCELPELTIGGALMQNADTDPVQYDGAVLIGAATWTLEAVGSYALVGGQPSLFVFARLDAELGGPPFFFVTGLCAGFGYNRSLRIPRRDEVTQFPLLAGIGDASKVGGAHPTPAQALAALRDWVAPARGVNWIAAGVQFTSFELARSNVVAVATITRDVQLAILGITRIKLAQTGPQFAYAELGLEAVLDPASGFLGFSAQLSPNSYVLSEQCHLTGGFAFWTWFDGEHAGDFVITLGGYHPAFIPPDHYPEVPRLAFSWQVSESVAIQGNAYFALTPSCAMGGGALDVQFHSGDLRAWFTARADFLFTWKPFYFVGSVSVSIGASYKVDLWFVSGTVSVELGASLEIWGPPTGGTVHVDWYIISFSIGFGAPKQRPGGFLAWNEFSTLLPRPAGTPALKASAAATPEIVVTTAIAEGLVATRDDGTWLVRGDALSFSIASAVPATSIALAGGAPVTYAPDDATLAVRPMGIASMTSEMTVTLTGPAGRYDLGRGWRSSPVVRGVPASMWGAPLAPGHNPGAPSADVLPERLVGVTGIEPPISVPAGPDATPLETLGHFVIDEGQHWLPVSAAEPPIDRQPRPTPASVQRIALTIQTEAADRRAELFDALRTLGYDAGADDDATAIAGEASLAWPDAPMLGAPWEVAA